MYLDESEIASQKFCFNSANTDRVELSSRILHFVNFIIMSYFCKIFYWL